MTSHAVVRRRRAPAPSIYGLADLRRDYEGWAVFVVFTALLFIPQGGSKAVMIALAAMGALFAVDPRRAVMAMWTRALLLPIGLFAVVSVIWSQHPPQTLRYSVQALVALAVGLRLSMPERPDLIPRGVFCAFGLYMVVSIALGHSVHVGAGEDTAFSGLNASKNYLADMAVVSLLSALAVLIEPARERASRLAWKGAAALIVVLDAYVLLAAHSAGALVGAAAASAVLCALAAVSGLGSSARVYGAAAGLVIAAVLFAERDALSNAASDIFTGVFHKDATLTGRLYLWYRAKFLVAAHPLLGTGYGAFWVQGDPEPEGLWQYLFIGTRSGISFHNTFYNYLVDLGWSGLILFLVGAVIGSLALVRAYLVQGGAAVCFWIALLEYEFARSPVEAVGLEPFGFTTILLYAGLGWGMGAGSLSAARAVTKRGAAASPTAPRAGPQPARTRRPQRRTA